ncbi:hypothetical protein LptCag_0489 [Leptospirillum ferriphilum]|uniref:Uncharacterized protein n=1 Tax=Leptospirillum ferriphilum TaxID=178606 RepID=A0A094X2G3_9BACT|nr:hypothetical protein LptCag_0489 [Leptospirillum ferriphilum]
MEFVFPEQDASIIGSRMVVRTLRPRFLNQECTFISLLSSILKRTSERRSNWNHY